MNLIWFILFGLAIFACTLIGYKRFHNTTLYALAIGGVVNANFFNAHTYPIDIFGISFGIDSIIYTLFVFCVILMYIKEGRKQAYLLAASSIIAIMFSATMQLVSDLLSKGTSFAVWNAFIDFTISSIVSAVAVIIMIETFRLLSNKFKLFNNPYILTLYGILLCTIINSTLYYGAVILLNGTNENTPILLLTSFIGKMFALGCSLLALYLFLIIRKAKENKTLS